MNILPCTFATDLGKHPPNKYISKNVCLTVTHIRKKKHPHQKFTKNTKNWNMQQSSSNHPAIHVFLPPRGVQNPCYLVPDLSRWMKLLGCSLEKSLGSNGGFFGAQGSTQEIEDVCFLYIYTNYWYSIISLDNLVLNKSWNCEFQLLAQFILLWDKALWRIQVQFQGGYPWA